MGKPSSGETGLIATHVIVGDGITALAFLESCRLCPGDTVLLLGRNASEFGRGVAYAKGQVGTPWRFAYLLNSPADDIDPAFADWLAQRWTMVQDVMQGRAPNWLAAAAPLVEAGDIHGVNAPREFYGDFMREQARATIARLERQGTQVRTLDDAATTLSVASDGITLTTAAGRTITAATVDVAPGGPSTLRIDGDDGPFSAPTVFGQEARIADHIKAGREIFCIGGNASMLDVLRLCQSLIPDEALRFVACAPDGDIPAPLIPRVPRKLTQPVLTTGHQTAQTLLDEIWHAIESAKAAGDGMREIRAGFRAHFLAHPLTSYLPNPEEARRVPATLRFWLRGGTRDTILDMHRLVSAGKAQMVPGFVTAVEHGPTGATVHISDGRDTHTQRQTGFVVNCAGAGHNSRYDPLTQNLLDQGLIEVCPVSKGLKVGAFCQTKSPAIRHLSPATTIIGEEVMAMPLYDAHMLRTYAGRARMPTTAAAS